MGRVVKRRLKRYRRWKKPIYRTPLADLVGALAKVHLTDNSVQKLRQMSRISLFIADEIGYLPLRKGDVNRIFQLVSTRYKKSATILTSNSSFTEWTNVLSDAVIAIALLDWLLHHSIVT